MTTHDRADALDTVPLPRFALVNPYRASAP